MVGLHFTLGCLMQWFVISSDNFNKWRMEIAPIIVYHMYHILITYRGCYLANTIKITLRDSVRVIIHFSKKLSEPDFKKQPICVHAPVDCLHSKVHKTVQNRLQLPNSLMCLQQNVKIYFKFSITNSSLHKILATSDELFLLANNLISIYHWP